MHAMLLHILFVVCAYLLGSVASAIVVCRLMGLGDPREGGSGNPGATNVLRLGGKKAAAITLVGDMAKGLIPAGLATGLGQPPLVVALVAVAAFLGHLYPIYFGFKGGKGFATAIGSVAGISWLVVTAMVITWGVVAGLTRYSSLGTLIAVALTPVYVWFIMGNLPLTGATIVIAVFMFWRHAGNIERLLDGTESRIGDKADKSPQAEPEAESP
jgi:acyl phosphate:glycerol-3-phosphate acyltransferase